MKTIFLFLATAGFATVSLASPAKSTIKGLHTGDRILLPIDNSQDTNYLFHKAPIKKHTIDAPLVTIEQDLDTDKKDRTMKIKSIIDIANPEKKLE